MYLTQAEQTGVLLETIEDAAQQVIAAKDAGLEGNSLGLTILAMFNLIVTRAKRHDDWPEKVRERHAKYEAEQVVGRAAASQAQPAKEPEQVF